MLPFMSCRSSFRTARNLTIVRDGPADAQWGMKWVGRWRRGIGYQLSVTRDDSGRGRGRGVDQRSRGVEESSRGTVLFVATAYSPRHPSPDDALGPRAARLERARGGVAGGLMWRSRGVVGGGTREQAPAGSYGR